MTRLTNKRTALQEATRLLARRSLSARELQLKLTQKCYGSEDIDLAIERLIDRGYLDDNALCRRLFIYYAETGYCGLRYILGKIKARGLKIDCLNEEINAWHGGENELERASALIKRKFPPPQQLPDHGKLARMLVCKGFSSYVIAKIIENTIND